jgi:hypothetical protein
MNKRGRKRAALGVLGILSAWFIFAACSLPNLEQPECTAARDAVRRFYSFHFAADMKPTAENLSASRPYLTDELYRTLSAQQLSAIDYFTQTDDYPRTFKIGACTVTSPDKTSLTVTLLWRDETRTQQREVNVDAVKTGDKWLINKIN